MILKICDSRSRYNFIAIYIVYKECTQISVSNIVIRRDFNKMKLVKCEVCPVWRCSILHARHPNFFLCHSALRLVGQNQSPVRRLIWLWHAVFWGKALGVVCHYFPPSLDILTFATRYLHVCMTREILVAKGGIMGENIVR